MQDKDKEGKENDNNGDDSGVIKGNSRSRVELRIMNWLHYTAVGKAANNVLFPVILLLMLIVIAAYMVFVRGQ